MHDIDRTQLEYSPELSSQEAESYEFGEQEWSGENYGETSGETVLGEAEEAELASELLEVTNEAELDRWRTYLGMPLALKPKHYPQIVTDPDWNKYAGWMVIAAQQQGLDAATHRKMSHRARQTSPHAPAKTESKLQAHSSLDARR